VARVHIAGAAIAGVDLVAGHHQLGRGGAAPTGTGRATNPGRRRAARRPP
jgi:hypothetical protein